MALQVWLPLNGNLDNNGVHNIHVSNSGATVVDTGKIGKAYSFDGVTNFIQLDNMTFMPAMLPKEWTITFWVYSDDEGKRSVYFSNYQLGGVGDVSFGFEKTANNVLRIVYNAGQFDINVSQCVIDTGKWVHLAISKDINHLVSVYKNGSLVHTFTDPDCKSNGTIYYLGRDSRSGDETPLKGMMNDFRIYDECLSLKQIKEISKGLIAHYKFNDLYAESTTNLAPGVSVGMEYTATKNPGWDTTLNGSVMYTPKGWGNGYNGGVTNQATGYHAHWVFEDGLPIMMFPNLNSVIDNKGRWLGISTSVPTNDILAGEKYTISWWQKTDNLKLAPFGGLYYSKTADGSNSFWDGDPVYGYNTKVNTWEYMTHTFTRSSDYVQNTKNQSIYIYGYNTTEEGTMYVKDVQIQKGDHATPYAIGNRPSSVLEYDAAGMGNGAPIVGQPLINQDTGRNSSSIKFNGLLVNAPVGAALTNSKDFTISGWFYRTGSGVTYYASAEKSAVSVCLEVSRFFVYSAGGTAYVGNYTSTANKWEHIVLVHDSTAKTLTLYINGEQKGQITTDGTLSANTTLNIGGRQNSAQFQGSISDFRIYTTVLSVNDIKELYYTGAMIDNQGRMYTYELKEKDENIFRSENIMKYTTSRTSTGYGQIVERGGENAIAIAPATFWQSTEANRGIILKEEIRPNTQYFVDMWIDGDDVIHNGSNVQQGIAVHYTDGTVDRLLVTGNQTTPMGYQHMQLITPAGKSIYSIEQNYYVNIPNYYRWDSIICPLDACNITRQGVLNTPLTITNSSTGKIHSSGVSYNCDIYEI